MPAGSLGRSCLTPEASTEGPPGTVPTAVIAVYPRSMPAISGACGVADPTPTG
jgi:hypothetical protein